MESHSDNNGTLRINIIGRGNVATHLSKALRDKTKVKMINPHDLEGIEKDCDIILISVKDDAIRSVAEKLKDNDKAIVAHTSGSTSIDILDGLGIRRYGVLYPMQTFSKEVSLDYKVIPFFIEGNSQSTADELKSLAALISNRVYDSDSEKRKKLHLASVFACNFVNHLWTISEEILTENGLDFEMLRPLIQETVAKLDRTSPYDGQTGPAVRKDEKILDIQREQLKDNPERLNIYNLLSESIIRSHDK